MPVFVTSKRKATALQYAAAFTVCLSALTFGAWLAWPSVALTPLSDGSQGIILTTSQKSSMVAMMDIGNVISPVFAGYLMDRIGRKPSIIIIGGFYVLASGFLLTATSFWDLYAARLLAGIGKGISFVVAHTYLAEIAQKNIRGSVSTMFMGFTNLGIVLEYVLGAVTSYNVVNYINVTIPVLLIGLMLLVPESPYYYLLKGKVKLAKTSLSRYRCISTTENDDDFKVLSEELNTMKETVERDLQNKSKFVTIFKTPGNRKALFITIPLAIFNRMSGISAAIAYGSITLPENGVEFSPHYFMISFGITLVVGNFLGTVLVDKVGRKPLMLFSSLISAVTQGITAIYSYLDRNQSINTTSVKWIPYACIIGFGLTFSMGLAFIPSLLPAELFPTNVKNHAGSLSTTALALTSVGIHKMFLTVTETAGVHIMFFIFCVSNILCAIFTAVFLFETKCKTFGEIQDILNGVESNYNGECVNLNTVDTDPCLEKL